MKRETKIEGVAANDAAETAGTSLRGEISASFAELCELLGEPNAGGDGYKVSTEWVLVAGGRTFTLYDYKETSLYGRGLPSVADFRALPSYSWHIGSHGGVEPLLNLLEQALAALRAKGEGIAK